MRKMILADDSYVNPALLKQLLDVRNSSDPYDLLEICLLEVLLRQQRQDKDNSDADGSSAKAPKAAPVSKNLQSHIKSESIKVAAEELKVPI